MTRNIAAHIGGVRQDVEKTYPNIDPSTGIESGQVARCGEEEVGAAVTAAHGASESWRLTVPKDRSRVLLRIAAAIADAEDELALAETLDTGKPLSQARQDVTVAAEYFEFYAHAVRTFYGDTIPVSPRAQVLTTHEPFGVTGHIIAWNYPMQLFARSVAPAIAAGNCSVVKPAAESPTTAVRIAELAIEQGLPAGVINVVPGLGPEAGGAILDHPGVRHIGFVGSTETGRRIAHAAAERVVPTVLELGGKSAQVVFADADIDEAATTISSAILQNAGQTCSAGSRLVVHRSIHEELLSRLQERFAAVSVGPAVDDPDMGPLISEKQLGNVEARITEVIADAPEAIVTGGRRITVPGAHGGFYFAPTIVDGIAPSHRIAQEEIFGPVLTVLEFDTEEEAVQIANGTPYALLGAVWTTNISRALRVARRIHAGQVYVNSYGAGGGVDVPFGGFRGSGYGREKGVEGLRAYMQSKALIIAVH